MLKLFDSVLTDVHSCSALVVLNAKVGALDHESFNHVGGFAAISRGDGHVQGCLPFRVLRINVNARLGDQIGQ